LFLSFIFIFINKIKYKKNDGYSDLISQNGMDITYRIKSTLEITGLSFWRVHIKKMVWHLDVDCSLPRAVDGSKGTTVRCIKWNLNWV